MHLLLIEDDRSLSHTLQALLREHNYSVDCVYDGSTGLTYARCGEYDIIICDLMIPEIDGLSVCKQLRREGISTPVLMLTARGSVADKIEGYDSGADDYMTKPFSTAELLAHLRALARRQGAVLFEKIAVGDLTLNLEAHELQCNDKKINLSQKEFIIAQLFMSAPTHTLTKDMIIAKAWDSENFVMDNNVEAYISFLRKKIRFVGSRVCIETMRKIGYKLVIDECDGADSAHGGAAGGAGAQAAGGARSGSGEQAPGNTRKHGSDEQALHE